MTGPAPRRRWYLLTGAALSAAWLALCAHYIDSEIGWDGFSFVLPHELGAMLAGVFAPLAFLWLLLAFLARGRDVAEHTGMLRQQLEALTFPSAEAAQSVEAASTVLRREADAVRAASSEGISLLGALGETLGSRTAELGEATATAGATLDQVRATLAAEIEATRGAAERLEAARTDWQGVVDGHGAAMQAAAAAVLDRLAAERDRWEERLAEERDRQMATTERMAGRLAEDREAWRGTLEQAIGLLQTTISESADRIGALMRERTAGIGGAIEQAVDQGQAIMGDLAATERRFAELAESSAARIDTALGRITETLGTVSDGAIERGERLRDVLAAQIEASATATDEAGARLARRLVTASDGLVNALGQAAEASAEHVASAEAETRALVRAVAAAGETRNEFERRLAEREQRLDEANALAMTRAAEASERLAALAANLAREIERPFQDNLASLRQVASETAANAEGIAEQLRLQATAVGKAVVEAQSHAKGLDTALEARIADMMHVGRRFVGEGAAMGEQLKAELEGALASQKRAGDELLTRFDVQLRQRIDELGRHLSEAGRSVAAEAGEQAGRIEAALRREALQVMQSAGEAQSQSERLAATLRNELDAVTAAGRRLMADGAATSAGLTSELEGFLHRLQQEGDRLLQEIERSVASRSDELGTRLSRLAETVASDTVEHGRAVEAHLQRRAEAIQRVGAEAQSASAGLGTSLEQQMALIQIASRALVADTNATGERLRGNLDRVAERLTGSGEALLGAFDASARERGEKLYRHFQALAQRMVEDAGRLADRLTTATAELGEGWRDTAAEADRLRANLATELGRLGELTTGASGELRAVIGDVEARLAALSDSSGRFVTRVESMLADSARHTTALTDAARTGEGQIQAAGQFFAEQAARLAAAASGAAGAERQMQDNLERLDRALTETAAGGAERIGGLEQRVRSLGTDLAAAAAEAERRTTALTTEFRDEAEGLVEIARKAAFQTAAVRGAVKEQLAELGTLAAQITQLVETVRSSLTSQAETLTAVTAEARTDTAAMHEELKEQASALTAAADRVAERLAEIGADVDGRAERLVAATDYATRRAGEIASGFGNPAQFLRDTVDRVTGQVAGLAAAFAEQSDQLVKSSTLAERQVATLRQTHESLAGDLFLKSATVMMEELNGLALDMQTLLDSDVPDDIWRDFHKGDRSVFARHLFRTRDSYVIPAIEQRYAEDDRFRDLVSRYMDRFEVLLARAQEIDPENVLNAAFITADVGKLYLVLARSLGRGAAS